MYQGRHEAMKRRIGMESDVTLCAVKDMNTFLEGVCCCVNLSSRFVVEWLMACCAMLGNMMHQQCIVGDRWECGIHRCSKHFVYSYLLLMQRGHVASLDSQIQILLLFILHIGALNINHQSYRLLMQIWFGWGCTT